MNLQSNYESIPKSSTHTHTHTLIFLFSNCLVTNENSPTSHTDSTPLDIAGSGVSVTTTGTGAACTGAGLFQGPEDFSMPPPPPPPSSQLLPGSSLFSVTSSSFSLPYLLCLNSKAAVIKLFLFEFFPFIFILGQGLGGGPGTPDTTPAERGRCSLWRRPAAPLLVPHSEEVVQARGPRCRQTGWVGPRRSLPLGLQVGWAIAWPAWRQPDPANWRPASPRRRAAATAGHEPASQPGEGAQAGGSPGRGQNQSFFLKGRRVVPGQEVGVVGTEFCVFPRTGHQGKAHGGSAE